RAAFHRLDGVVHRAGGGDDDHQGADFLGAGDAEHLESAYAGHHDIDQRHIEAPGAERVEGALAVTRLFDREAGGLQAVAEHEPDGLVVVGDQHGRETVLFGLDQVWICCRHYRDRRVRPRLTIVTVSLPASQSLTGSVTLKVIPGKAIAAGAEESAPSESLSRSPRL